MISQAMLKLLFACLVGFGMVVIWISLVKQPTVHTFLHKLKTPNTKPTCTPITRVFFLKVHKAGSSTMASIIQRFGLTRDLNFVVPNRTFEEISSNYIGKLGKLQSVNEIMSLPGGRQYDIFWNHVIYNRTVLKSVMPTDTSYIAIVRQPFQQFVSAFEYYGPGEKVTDEFYDMESHQDLIEDYLKHPWDFQFEGEVTSHTINSLAYDFGFTNAEIGNKNLRYQYLDQLGKDFELVMLLEYFDESLVLLKRYFCWDIKDIIYFHRNRNKDKRDFVFSQEYHMRHRIIAETDYNLYDYFYQIFWEKVWRQGPDFFLEVSYFKQLLPLVMDHCLLNKTLHVNGNIWHKDFLVDWEDCQYINSTEFDLYEVIYNKTVALNSMFT